MISPLKSPAIYLAYLFIASLLPLPARVSCLQGCGKGPRCLTLRQEPAAGTTTLQRGLGWTRRPASRTLLLLERWRAGAGHGTKSSAQHPPAAAVSESLASAVAEAGATCRLLGNERNELHSLPVQILLAFQLGADSGIPLRRVSQAGGLSHRSLGFAFLRGTTAEPQHPPHFIWAALLKMLKHTVCSLGIHCPVPSSSSEQGKSLAPRTSSPNNHKS